MRKLSFIFLLTLYYCGFSQEIDIDFNDNLHGWQQSSPGHWCIDSKMSLNGTACLHHCFDSSMSGRDMIAYPHMDLLLDSAVTVWEFTVQYGYSPSSSNNWAIWLTSDSPVTEMYPGGNAEGYIIGVNYTGNDDVLKIWKQNDRSKNIVFESNYNWQSNDLIDTPVLVRVVRNIEGIWEVYIRNDEQFILLGSGGDNSLNTSGYIGIYYAYTSTQDMKLWIDDFRVSGFFYDDKTAPAIETYELINRTSLKLLFTEPIDLLTHTTFILNGSAPSQINQNSSIELTLKFDEIFLEENFLLINNISDKKGNVSKEIPLNFDYRIPQKYDILITELMADPTPTVGLPDCEYIELYNNTGNHVNLSNWYIISGDREPHVLSNFVLKPDSFIVLLDDKDQDEFNNNILVQTLNDLPSLPNAGETIQLFDDYGFLIHSVTYSLNTYYDDLKKDGGWSIELINPKYPCLGEENWNASRARSGGTPGERNSLDGMLTPYPTARIRHFEIPHDTVVSLYFERLIDSTSATNVSNYKFEGGEISISQIDYVNEISVVNITLHDRLQLGERYLLSLSEKILDCAGIPVSTNVIEIGMPENPGPGDVVINELLYESTDIKPEFVELYNASDMVINLQDISFCRFDPYLDTITQSVKISDESVLFFPGDFCVLTSNKDLMMHTFDLDNSQMIVEPKHWINLVNDGAILGLANSANQIIDKIIYEANMHFPLLSSTAGISLERINSQNSGMIHSNWGSAAETSGYATPLEENSQQAIPIEKFNCFQLSSEYISPDNDGVDDYLRISYTFPYSDYVINVRIFNQRGQEIKTLANHILCGTQGEFIWNGFDENEQRVKMGYYILLIEAWHPNGDIKKEKQVVMLLPEKK